MEIVAAQAADLDEIKRFLVANQLPVAGVDDHWQAFVIARDGGEIVACGGAELYGDAALLRSIAVRADRRNNAIGDRIVQRILELIARRGVRNVFLLTTTAERYFEKRGFVKVDRSAVVPQLHASREFQDACPASAACMRLVIAA